MCHIDARSQWLACLLGSAIFKVRFEPAGYFMSLAKSSFYFVSLGLLLACGTGPGSGGDIGASQAGIPGSPNSPPGGNPNSPPGGGSTPGGSSGGGGGGGSLDCVSVCNAKNNECGGSADCQAECAALNPTQSQLQCIQAAGCSDAELEACLQTGSGGSAGTGGGPGTGGSGGTTPSNCTTADQCAQCTTCEDFCSCIAPDQYDLCLSQTCG